MKIRFERLTGVLLALCAVVASASAASGTDNDAHTDDAHAKLAKRYHNHSQLRFNPTTTSSNASPDSPLDWPWHGKSKNKTHDDQSCNNHTSCSTCAQSSWCHWCSHSDTCHAVGSVYGCVSGSSCVKPPPKNETDPTGCTTHDSCSTCALASHLCHWCAHDNGCHAVGSYYGCVTGVDCYSNDRCKRTEPELIQETVFTDIAPLPFLVLVTVAAVLFCCASTCFCVAGGVKGAYDDLAGWNNDNHNDDDAAPAVPFVQDNGHDDEPDVVVVVQAAAAEEPQVVHSESQEENVPGEADDAAANDDTEHLTRSEEGHHATDYVRMQDEEEQDGLPISEEAPLLASPLLGQQQPQQRQSARRPRHMQRMYNTCFACYIVTVAIIVSSTIAAIRFFPTRPEYNICNNDVAWKSLIDSMESMKMSADFEILASVSNPNNFDVALDMGKGSFRHDGAFVGTFDIPPVTATAMSVTDMMIIAHFSPERWSALSISAEYYRGKLILDVDVAVSVRVPALFDYSISTKLENLEVHVNEMSDRHLCQCPDWSEAKNNTPPAWLLL